MSDNDHIRLDKWLWHARFYKTRSLASTACRGGKIRVNGRHIKKASGRVTPGDILTFTKHTQVFVVRIKECGVRRGPASEAILLYEDLSPKQDRSKDRESGLERPQTAQRDKGSGRPTKADRRALDKLKDF